MRVIFLPQILDTGYSFADTHHYNTNITLYSAQSSC